MHSRNGKHLDVISNDSEGCLSNENTKTPNLSDYQIHTDTEETSSDDNFNNNVDSSSISRASSLFRGRSKGSHISNNDSDSEKPHRSFSELLSSIFHKNKTRNSNPVSSSFATTETHRENFLNDEYQDDENYASNLDNLLYQDIEKSPSSQISFNMNSSHDADQMDKDTPLTPNTNDNKVTSQFNNGVRVTNSDSYYSNKLTNTYSKFYNFYESLDIGTLSQENNTDIDSLMRHIKIIWDNKQNKINSLQEVNLSLEQKVDVLQRKNSNIQSQLEEKNQSHNNLADKYKKCTAIFYKLVETCNNEIDSDQEENYHSKTKNNQDFNKLIEIVQNAPNWRKRNIILQQENNELKESNRRLTKKVQNSNDRLEDRVYESLKAQFERKMDKLEECIEEHKEKNELLEQRNLETINKYKNEKQKILNTRNERDILANRIQLLDCQKNESLQFMSQFMNSFSNYVDKEIVFDYNILLESLTSKLNMEFLLEFDDAISGADLEKIETQLHQFYQEVAVGKFMHQMISQFIKTEGTNNILNNHLENLVQQCDDQKKYINDLRYYVKRLKKRLKEYERLNSNNIVAQ